MIQLLRALDFDRYTPRTYILSQGDHLSASKANELELSKSAVSSCCHPIYTFKSSRQVDQPLNMRIITLPRAREVRQPLFTTPFSTSKSFMHSLIEISIRPALRGKPLADLLVLNGPGTCVAVVGAFISVGYVRALLLFPCWRQQGRIDTEHRQFLGLPAPRVIYIESFTRVKDVSLSGWLLRPFVDR
jgi:beta-1,4-N-acetylglucosaminyltransferase